MSSYTNWIRKLQSKERNSGPHSLEKKEWDALRAIEAAAPDMAEALRQIQELAKPGQTMSLSDAIDALCDIWNIARIAEAKATGQ